MDWLRPNGRRRFPPLQASLDDLAPLAKEMTG